MDSELVGAVVAFCGIYAPLSPPYSFMPDLSSKPIASSTKTTALRCVATDECPPDTCERKRSGRCLPSKDHQLDREPGTVQLNNTITGDLYASVDVLEILGENYANNVPVMFSRDSNAMVLPFRTGQVRARDLILADANAFLDQLCGLLETSEYGNPGSLVLCGHSEGGVLAEAMAVACTQSSRFMAAYDIRRVFLVATGAHLWMARSERDLVERWFSNRFASFAMCERDDDDADALALRYDPFLLEQVGRFEYVSLPKTVLIHDAGAWRTMTECAFASGVTEIWCAGSPITAAAGWDGRALHEWTLYERGIRGVYSRFHSVVGGARRWIHRTSTIALAAITATIALASGLQ